MAVAFRALHPAPFVAGQIVHDLDRTDAELFVVVDHDIRGRALAQEAAILEPGAEGRKRAAPPVDFLQRQPSTLAHEGCDTFGRVASGSEELSMGAAVRYSEGDVRIVDDILHQRRIAIDGRSEEL